MNRKLPAVLFHRTYVLKSGGKSTIWWYYVTEETGRRLRFSLGTSSKTEARAKLLQLIRAGSLIPKHQSLVRLRDFVADFWSWDKSDYVRSKLLRGDRISRYWAFQNGQYVKNHILPALGEAPLASITVSRLEGFLIELKEKGLSNKSVNQILGCLRIMFTEACRLGIVDKNPCQSVRPLKNAYHARGILTPEEVRLLFRSADVWKNEMYYSINLAACTTGARLGELRALTVEKVRSDSIVVDSVIRRMEGFVAGDTKTGRSGMRIVPIPRITALALAKLCIGKTSSDFVFSCDGSKPVGASNVVRVFRDALRRIGIPLDRQFERSIDFHSWRHFFNSMLRGKVSDVDLRHATGHLSGSMTERYSHRIPEQIEQFRNAQEDVFAMVTR